MFKCSWMKLSSVLDEMVLGLESVLGLGRKCFWMELSCVLDESVFGQKCFWMKVFFRIWMKVYLTVGVSWWASWMPLFHPHTSDMENLPSCLLDICVSWVDHWNNNRLVITVHNGFAFA